MPNNPKVTVILTSFNHAKYLREAIDSAINQTFSDFELIIWDDASSDNSWEIIQSYDDKRIKAFRNGEQKQARYGINKAIEEIAQGEYIAIHHSDDIWDLEKLEKQVAFLDKNPHIGAVFSDVLVIDENSDPLAKNSHFYQKVFAQPNRTRHEWLNHFFYKGNALAHPSVLIRRKCYFDCGTYRYGFPAADHDMWVRLCMRYDIHVLSEKLIKIRIRDNAANMSASRPDSRQKQYFQLLQILRIYKRIVLPDELQKIFPEAAPYIKSNGVISSFLLAMMALKSGQTHNILKLFGLELLFELMNVFETRKQVEEIYGFKINDYFEYIGKQDIFSIELVDQLRASNAQKDALLANKDVVLAQKDALLAQKDAFIEEILNSKAWKLITVYRKIISRNK